MLNKTPNILANSNLRTNIFYRSGKFEEERATRILKAAAFPRITKCLARKAGLYYRRLSRILFKIQIMDIARNNVPVKAVCFIVGLKRRNRILVKLI